MKFPIKGLYKAGRSLPVFLKVTIEQMGKTEIRLNPEDPLGKAALEALRAFTEAKKPLPLEFGLGFFEPEADCDLDADAVTFRFRKVDGNGKQESREVAA